MRTHGQSIIFSSATLKWAIIVLFFLIAVAAFYSPPLTVVASSQLALMKNPPATSNTQASIEHQGRLAGAMENFETHKRSSSIHKNDKPRSYPVGLTGIRG